MIKVNSKGARLKGSREQLLTELTMTIKGFHETLSEDIGSENAKKLLMESIELAFMSEEELHKRALEALERLFGKAGAEHE